MKTYSPHLRFLAFILSALLLLEAPLDAAPHVSPPPGNAPMAIPEKLGTVDEVHAGSIRKEVIFIQDAHDSLDAQEKIAEIIDHLVDQEGVQSVFEEGYDGPVPTDDYFARFKDPDLRKRISYYLLDELRIGAAEYAHINRKKNFDLIGLDDGKLYLENIKAYRRTARGQAKADRELGLLENALILMTDERFSSAMKTWMKLKVRHEAGTLDLDSYLQRTLQMRFAGESQESRNRTFARLYPAIFGEFKKRDDGASEGLASMDLSPDIRQWLREISALEDHLSEKLLASSQDRKLYQLVKKVRLLRRMNSLALTQQEYAVIEPLLHELTTEDFADFITEETRRPAVFSKRWERNLAHAQSFYRTAGRRDQALEEKITRFIHTSGERPMALVFGGFHAQAIRSMLQKLGVSYRIVTPKIEAFDETHRARYRKRMTESENARFDNSQASSSAARPLSDFAWVQAGPPRGRNKVVLHNHDRIGAAAGRGANSLVQIRSELRAQERPRREFEQSSADLLTEVQSATQKMLEGDAAERRNLNRRLGDLLESYSQRIRERAPSHGGEAQIIRGILGGWAHAVKYYERAALWSETKRGAERFESLYAVLRGFRREAGLLQILSGRNALGAVKNYVIHAEHLDSDKIIRTFAPDLKGGAEQLLRYLDQFWEPVAGFDAQPGRARRLKASAATSYAQEAWRSARAIDGVLQGQREVFLQNTAPEALTTAETESLIRQSAALSEPARRALIYGAAFKFYGRMNLARGKSYQQEGASRAGRLLKSWKESELTAEAAQAAILAQSDLVNLMTGQKDRLLKKPLLEASGRALAKWVKELIQRKVLNPEEAPAFLNEMKTIFLLMAAVSSTPDSSGQSHPQSGKFEHMTRLADNIFEKAKVSLPGRADESGTPGSGRRARSELRADSSDRLQAGPQWGSAQNPKTLGSFLTALGQVDARWQGDRRKITLNRDGKSFMFEMVKTALASGFGESLGGWSEGDILNEGYLLRDEERDLPLGILCRLKDKVNILLDFTELTSPGIRSAPAYLKAPRVSKALGWSGYTQLYLLERVTLLKDTDPSEAAPHWVSEATAQKTSPADRVLSLYLISEIQDWSRKMPLFLRPDQPVGNGDFQRLLSLLKAVKPAYFQGILGVGGVGTGVDSILSLLYGADKVEGSELFTLLKILGELNVNYAHEAGILPTDKTVNIQRRSGLPEGKDIRTWFFNLPIVVSKGRRAVLNTQRIPVDLVPLIGSIHMDQEVFEKILRQASNSLHSYPEARFIARLHIEWLSDGGNETEDSGYTERLEKYLNNFGLSLTAHYGEYFYEIQAQQHAVQGREAYLDMIQQEIQKREARTAENADGAAARTRSLFAPSSLKQIRWFLQKVKEHPNPHTGLPYRHQDLEDLMKRLEQTSSRGGMRSELRGTRPDPETVRAAAEKLIEFMGDLAQTGFPASSYGGGTAHGAGPFGFEISDDPVSAVTVKNLLANFWAEITAGIGTQTPAEWPAKLKELRDQQELETLREILQPLYYAMSRFGRHRRERDDFEDELSQVFSSRAQESSPRPVRILVAGPGYLQEAIEALASADAAMTAVPESARGRLAVEVIVLDKPGKVAERYKANTLIYHPDDVKNFPESVRARYLVEEEGFYKIRPEQHARLTFKSIDLNETSDYTALNLNDESLDFILNHNLSIYLELEASKRFLDYLNSVLRESGILYAKFSMWDSSSPFLRDSNLSFKFRPNKADPSSIRSEMRMFLDDWVRLQFTRAEVPHLDEHLPTRYGIFRRTLNSNLEPLTAFARKTDAKTVLDLGSGQGDVVFAFARDSHAARVIGIEGDAKLFSDSERVRQVVSEDVRERINFYQGDFNDPQFSSKIQESDLVNYWETGSRSEPALIQTLGRYMRPGTWFLLTKNTGLLMPKILRTGFFDIDEQRSLPDRDIFLLRRNEKPFVVNTDERDRGQSPVGTVPSTPFAWISQEAGRLADLVDVEAAVPNRPDGQGKADIVRALRRAQELSANGASLVEIAELVRNAAFWYPGNKKRNFYRADGHQIKRQLGDFSRTVQQLSRRNPDPRQAKQSLSPDLNVKTHDDPRFIFLTSIYRRHRRDVLWGFLKTRQSWGAKRFILRDGMNYGDVNTWWNLKSRQESHGEERHTGVDLALFEKKDGSVATVSGGLSVFALMPGKVKWIFDDAMRQTVILESELDGKKYYSVYTHIQIAEGLVPGMELEGGALLGKTAVSINEKSIVAPHVHYGLAFFSDPDIESGQVMNYDKINRLVSEGKMVFEDMVEMMPKNLSRKLFAAGSEWESQLGQVVIWGTDQEEKSLKKLLHRQFPGLKDLSIKKRPEWEIKRDGDRWTLYNQSGSAIVSADNPAGLFRGQSPLGTGLDATVLIRDPKGESDFRALMTNEMPRGLKIVFAPLHGLEIQRHGTVWSVDDVASGKKIIWDKEEQDLVSALWSLDAKRMREARGARSELRKTGPIDLRDVAVEEMKIPAAVLMDARELTALNAEGFDTRFEELLLFLEGHSAFDLYLHDTDALAMPAAGSPLDILLKRFPEQVHWGEPFKAKIMKKGIVLHLSLGETTDSELQTRSLMARLKETYQLRSEPLPADYLRAGTLKGFLNLAESYRGADLIRGLGEAYAVRMASGRWRLAEGWSDSLWKQIKNDYAIRISA